MVFGVRVNRADKLSRRVCSRLGRFVMKLVLGMDFADPGCGIRVFRRELIEVLPDFDGMHRFFPYLAAGAGFKVKEMPVRHHPRRSGRSKYGFWNRLFPWVRGLVLTRRFIRQQRARAKSKCVL